MRTTIRIDDELLKEAKSIAAASGTTLAEVVEGALRESLSRRRELKARKRITLLSYGGGVLMPGVDLNDSAGLLDIMERTDASS